MTRARQVFFNRTQIDTSEAKGPELLNNEALQAIDNAGTGLVDIIKVATTGDTVILPNGVNIPTSKYLTVTDADGLSVGGRIVPQTFQLTLRLPGSMPATAGNYGVFDTVRFACKIVAVNERHATAGSDGGAVTAMVKKVPSGTAVAAGTDCLSAGINLKATADTNQNGALHATPGNYTFAAGDGIGVALTGTPTAIAGLVITVTMQRV